MVEFINHPLCSKPQGRYKKKITISLPQSHRVQPRGGVCVITSIQCSKGTNLCGAESSEARMVNQREFQGEKYLICGGFIFVFNASGVFACMCVCTLCFMQEYQKMESPGTRDIDRHELSRWYWELNPILPQSSQCS